jgi:hypothetical protein
MTHVEETRPRPLQLDEDHALLEALLDVGSYAPARLNSTLDKVLTKAAAMVTAQTREAQSHIAATAARSQAVAAEWEFHHTIRAVKDEICAQFGIDPEEVMALARHKRAKYELLADEMKPSPSA